MDSTRIVVRNSALNAMECALHALSMQLIAQLAKMNSFCLKKMMVPSNA